MYKRSVLVLDIDNNYNIIPVNDILIRTLLNKFISINDHNIMDYTIFYSEKHFFFLSMFEVNESTNEFYRIYDFRNFIILLKVNIIVAM